MGGESEYEAALKFSPQPSVFTQTRLKKSDDALGRAARAAELEPNPARYGYV